MWCAQTRDQNASSSVAFGVAVAVAFEGDLEILLEEGVQHYKNRADADDRADNDKERRERASLIVVFHDVHSSMTGFHPPPQGLHAATPAGRHFAEILHNRNSFHQYSIIFPMQKQGAKVK